MKNNPLNDLIYNENELISGVKYFSSQEKNQEENFEKNQGDNSKSEDKLDLNDNIFLFLD